MSHKTRIKMSEELLLPVIVQMCNDNSNMHFIQGQKTYTWYSGQGVCDHAIKVDGCEYEIGVRKVGDHWELETDFYYTGGLGEVFGENGGKLSQGYSFTKAKMAAKAKGMTYYEAPSENGWRKLVVNMQGSISSGTGKPGPGQGKSWAEW